MKNIRLTHILAVTFVLLLTSCSSSSSSDGLETGTDTIQLSSSATTIDLGGTFTFTVKDDHNSDVTSQSVFYIDNNAISGNTFTPNAAGTYTVSAKYANITSQSILLTVNATATLSSIILSSDKNELILGETATLSVFGNEGTDFTSSATFYVNGTQIPGNSYTPSARGTDVVTATYDTFTSNELTLVTGFTQKVLIEDYTGAWCGWCPRVAYGIEQVENQTNNAVIAAIHRGNSSGDYYDPYNYPAESLESFINLQGYPTAKINRLTTWDYPEPENVSQVLGYANGANTTGLAVSSTLTGTTLDITVKINFLGNALNGEKLVVYILENGLVLNQTNYTQYYGGVSVIQNFVHNNVLRQVPTDIFGDAITASELDATTNNYVKSFNTTLTTNIENTANLSLAVFVVSSSGNVINVQSAAVGENKDFD
ncbi:Omp28-related outer membrane protein [Lutibacter sp.]